jgi:phosphatidylglycerophosphate synthase
VLLGPGGLVLGGVLVLLAAFADGLDGAVAVVTGTASRLGFVYDSVADRIGEVAWLAAFWLAGAPGWLVVGTGAVSWLHEYVRARAAAAGMADIGAVTVGSDPPGWRWRSARCRSGAGPAWCTPVGTQPS